MGVPETTAILDELHLYSSEHHLFEKYLRSNREPLTALNLASSRMGRERFGIGLVDVAAVRMSQASLDSRQTQSSDYPMTTHPHFRATVPLINLEEGGVPRHKISRSRPRPARIAG